MMRVSPNEVMLVREFNSMKIFRYSNDAVAQRELNQTCLKAIFVVKFDVNEGEQFPPRALLLDARKLTMQFIKKGNVIEWQHPRDVELPGVEFKAMVSGSHNIDDDIVYVPLICVSSKLN